MAEAETVHIGVDGSARQLAVEYRKLDDLVPYARNARTHSEAQVAEIAGSIREFGFTNPVLISDDGTLIAGHGRVLAARPNPPHGSSLFFPPRGPLDDGRAVLATLRRPA